MQVHAITLFLFDFLDDDTRVKLNMVPGNEGSDFINANWIDVRSLISLRALVFYYFFAELLASKRLHRYPGTSF